MANPTKFNLLVNSLGTAPVKIEQPHESFSASSSANSWTSDSTTSTSSAASSASRSAQITSAQADLARRSPGQISMAVAMNMAARLSPVMPRTTTPRPIVPYFTAVNTAVAINPAVAATPFATVVAPPSQAPQDYRRALAPDQAANLTAALSQLNIKANSARASSSSVASTDSMYSASSSGSSSSSASATVVQNNQPPLNPQDQDEYDYIMSLLIDDQGEHVENALRIYRSGGFGGTESKIVVDTSPPGCGKTHTTCAIAALLHLDLYVVAEKSQLGFWREVAPTYGVYIIDAVTYTSLSTNRWFLNKELVHTPPRRGNGPGKNETIFTATQKWLDLLYGWERDQYGNATAVNRPILVVFDECQNIKNINNKTRAVQALVAPLLPPDPSQRPARQVAEFLTGPDGVPRPPQHQLPPSVAMFCSGTPFDKEEMALNFLQTFGLYTHDRLCRHDIQVGMVYDGFQEVMHNIRRLVPNADVSEGYQLMNRQSKSGVLQRQVFTWFERYIKNKWIISMEMPKIDVPLDVKAGYYTIPLGRSGQYGDLLMELMHVMNYDLDTGVMGEEEQGARGVLFSIMPQLERFKVEDIMIPEGLKILNNTVKDKVVFFVSSLDSIDTLMRAFQAWNPLVLSGAVSGPLRTQRINLFQNSPQYRIFITNLAVGATGISLHDTVGDAPRHSFIIPIHSIEKVAQAVRRVYRRGTKSTPTVRVVFVNIDVSEQGLLDALARKTEVYKRLLDKQVRSGIIFPGDYEVVKYGQTVQVRMEQIREVD